MNLRAKRELAARTFGVGKARIMFVKERLAEVKEAITKQDIRDLQKDGAIKIKEVKGRKKIENKHKRRSVGNIRKNVNSRKRNYIIMTRKLRNYIADMKTKGKLSREEIKEIRKRIRNKAFKSKAHLKEHIGQENKFAISGNAEKSKKVRKNKK